MPSSNRPQSLPEQVRLAWASAARGEAPELSRLMAGGAWSDAEIADSCVEDAEQRLERGMAWRLEHYAASMPELAGREEVARSLLMLECSERAAEGMDAVGADLRARFPALIEQIDAVTEMIGLMRSVSAEAGPRIAEGAMLDDYRLEELLGAGSFGEVWRAWDRTLERYVALKLITPRAGSEGADGTLAAVIREAKSAASIDHENVVRVHDAGRFMAAHLCYIDTQLAGDPAPNADDPKRVAVARSLAALVHDRGGKPLAARDGAAMMVGVARGVAAAHARGIVHRDIKPSNILVTPSGRPMVADFGLSALSARLDTPGGPAGSGPEGTIAATLGTGRITGTPAFMAPEQARGEAATPASDVFSLGATLRFVLTAKLPFAPSGKYSTDERWDVIEQVRRFECATLAAERPDLPGDLAAICDRAMAPDAKHRYPAAAALAEDLAAFMEGRPTAARPPGPVRAGAMWAARNRAVVSLVALMAVLGSGGLWRYIVNIGHERDRAVAAEAATALQLNETEKARASAQAVNDFLQSVMGAADPQLLGKDAKMLDAVGLAVGGIEPRFRGQPELEADVRETVGGVYTMLGRYDDAFKHLGRALELRRQTLGDRAAETFIVRHMIAKLHEDQVNQGETGKVLEDLVTEMRSVLGPDHRATLRAEVSLLTALASRHRLEEAVAIGERVIAARLRIGDADTIETMQAEQVTYALMCYTGRTDEGVARLFDLLDRQERLLGRGHYQRAVTMVDVAFTLKFFRRYEEALAVYMEALESLSGHLPPGHEHQLVLGWGIANLLATQMGHPREAIAILQPIFDAYMARPDHPTFHVAGGFDILGVSHLKAGLLPESERLLLRARAEYVRMMGAAPNDTLRAIDRFLAQTYDGLGLAEKACEHRELARSRTGPPNPPSR